jgi:hypothetical protein
MAPLIPARQGIRRSPSLALGVFSLLPGRRQNVRVVTGLELRQRQAMGRAWLSGRFANLLLLGAGFAVEHALTRWFFESRALHYYLSRIAMVDVGDLPGKLAAILAYVQKWDDRGRGRDRGSSGAGAGRALFPPDIQRVLALVVHLSGRLTVPARQDLVVAPNSGVHCLHYTFSLTQHYLEKVTVTKRRKLPSSKKTLKSKASTKPRAKTNSRPQNDHEAAQEESPTADDSADSEYEEWEEDQVVQRSEVLQSGSGVAPGPFAICPRGAMFSHRDASASDLKRGVGAGAPPREFWSFTGGVPSPHQAAGGIECGIAGGAGHQSAAHALNVMVETVTLWGGRELVFEHNEDAEHGLTDLILVRTRVQHALSVARASCNSTSRVEMGTVCVRTRDVRTHMRVGAITLGYRLVRTRSTHTVVWHVVVTGPVRPPNGRKLLQDRACTSCAHCRPGT